MTEEYRGAQHNSNKKIPINRCRVNYTIYINRFISKICISKIFDYIIEKNMFTIVTYVYCSKSDDDVLIHNNITLIVLFSFNCR